MTAALKAPNKPPIPPPPFFLFFPLPISLFSPFAHFVFPYIAPTQGSIHTKTRAEIDQQKPEYRYAANTRRMCQKLQPIKTRLYNPDLCVKPAANQQPSTQSRPVHLMCRARQRGTPSAQASLIQFGHRSYPSLGHMPWGEIFGINHQHTYGSYVSFGIGDFRFTPTWSNES